MNPLIEKGYRAVLFVAVALTAAGPPALSVESGAGMMTAAADADAVTGVGVTVIEPPAVKDDLNDIGRSGGSIDPGNISIDFKDADIMTVLRVLSEKSGVNIVAGHDVTGEVTIRLVNVNWTEALGMICKNYAYAFEREGNIIRVTTLENLQQEELVTEVFALNYAKASEVANSVEEMLSERGRDKIKFDERTNLLIVTDIPTNIYKIRQVIGRLDMKTPQVLIEARIIETTLDEDENMGIDWNLKLTAAGAKRPTTIPFTLGGEMPYLGIPTNDWNRYMPRPEGDTTVNIDDTTGTVTTTTESAFPIGNIFDQKWDSPFPVMNSSDFAFGVLDFTEFQMVLEFLKQRRDTDVLSNPKIATLNNQQANILVGEVIGIPVFERNPETGTVEITGYKEKQVGVILDVTPHINAEGYISVDLVPEISALLGWDIIDSARGIRAPRFSTRKADTQVMVHRGETIMIGGLIKENTVDVEKKVPFLGDLPLLDKVFSKTSEEVDKTELIIFMTVYILNDEGPAPSYGPAVNTAVVPIADN